MNCRIARRHIYQEPDHPLSARARHALELHLANCRSCRSVQNRNDALAATLYEDAESLAAASSPTQHFSNSLHRALLAEYETRQARPICRVQSALAGLFATRRGLFATCSLVLQPVLVILLAMLALLCSPVVHHEPATPSRLVSLSVRTDDTGRARAELTRRTAAPRPMGERPLP